MTDSPPPIHGNCCPLCKEKVIKLEQLVNLLCCYMSDYLPNGASPAIIRSHSITPKQNQSDQIQPKHQLKKKQPEQYNLQQQKQCVRKIDELVRLGRSLGEACTFLEVSPQVYQRWKSATQRQSDFHTSEEELIES